MRLVTRPSAAADVQLTGLKVVMWNRIAFMRRTSPLQRGPLRGTRNTRGPSTVATVPDAVERNPARCALSAHSPQQVRQHGERGARVSVGRDQRGVPARVAA